MESPEKTFQLHIFSCRSLRPFLQSRFPLPAIPPHSPSGPDFPFRQSACPLLIVRFCPPDNPVPFLPVRFFPPPSFPLLIVRISQTDGACNILKISNLQNGIPIFLDIPFCNALAYNYLQIPIKINIRHIRTIQPPENFHHFMTERQAYKKACSKIVFLQFLISISCFQKL